MPPKLNMDYREQIQTIRSDYLRGKISLDDAKGAVQPLLDVMNKKGEVVAKQHGKRFKKLTFGYVFR